MIKAEMNRKMGTVQVDLEGSVGDIELEMIDITKTIEEALENTFEDIDERYHALEAFRRILENGGNLLKYRIRLHETGATEEEIASIREMTDGEKTGDEMKKLAKMAAEIVERKRQQEDADEEVLAAEEKLVHIFEDEVKETDPVKASEEARKRFAAWKEAREKEKEEDRQRMEDDLK